MRLIINESEKQRIIGLYKPSFLLEQAGNVTISDLQSLIGVGVDNVIGPQTIAALKQILQTIPGNGCSTTGARPVPDVEQKKGFNPLTKTDFTK